MEICLIILLLIILFVLMAATFGVPLTDMIKFYNNEINENKNQIVDKRKYRKKISKVKPNNDFENLYNEIYNEEYKELEKRRKKYRKSYIIQIISCVCILGSFVGIILSLGFMGSVMSEILTKATKSAIIFTISFFVFIIIFIKNKNYSHYYAEYIYYFKNNIIGRIIKYTLGEAKYNYGQNKYDKDYLIITKRLYEKANFNNSGLGELTVSDYISTNLNIIVADVKDNIKAFNGMFAFSKITKSIPERICIIKNNMGLYYNEAKIKLDSEEFEKNFDVHCNNNILALQLLTSDTLALINDFYNKLNLQFEIIFDNNGMYIRFFTGNILEPRIFRKSLNKNEIFIYYTVLDFINTLSNKINKITRELNI